MTQCPPLTYADIVARDQNNTKLWMFTAFGSFGLFVVFSALEDLTPWGTVFAGLRVWLFPIAVLVWVYVVRSGRKSLKLNCKKCGHNLSIWTGFSIKSELTCTLCGHDNALEQAE